MVSENITEEKQNSLFNRKEVKLIIESKATPSKVEAQKIVAGKFTADSEFVAVKKILGKFGRNTFLIIANIYKSKEDKDKGELKPKKKKEKKA